MTMNDRPIADDPESRALRLAETLATRLCHDLSGPLGSLAGAVELAAEEATDASEALEVALESATALSRRLRLLRAAWGSDSAPLHPEEIVALAAGLAGAERLRLDVAGLAPVPLPASAARLVLNLLLLGAEALPRGGVLALSGGLPGGILLAPTGPRAAWPADLLSAIAAPDAPSATLADPRRIQSPLTLRLCRSAGFSLTLDKQENGADHPPPLRLRPG